MSTVTITLLLFALLFLLLAFGLPLPFCFGGTAVLFIIWQWGFLGLYTLATTAMSAWTEFIFISAPLFIFMANILERSGLAEDLYEMMYRWMGPIRGGLAIGTIIICTLFAAMSGISAAATITMGLIALPSMLNRGYNSRIAVGCIAAGGSLGILIPPSVLMILYAGLTGVSIGKLFIAGIFPGLVLSGIFIAYIAIRCGFRPHLGPPIPIELRSSLAYKLKSLTAILAPAFLILLVLGVMYTGVCTPTEAAGIGAAGAVLVMIVNRRFRWKAMQEATMSTFRLTVMIMWIVLGAKVFTSLYLAVGASQMLTDIFVQLDLNRWVIMGIMQFILLILGCFVDPAGIMMICTPVFVPIVERLGFDPIWFGVLFTINMEMGYITPPFGFNLFYMKAVASPLGVSTTDIYKSIGPFVVLEVIGLIIMMIYPEISLYLPNTMK
jgi:tripartite ATP-independent transporter DctM subunit